MTSPAEVLGVREISAVLPRCELHHVDITCDGCNAEPIVGKRYKCQRCQDIDLCEPCCRAIMAARISIHQQLGGDPPLPVPSTSGVRGSNWISRVKGDDAKKRWQALMETVPCLHSSHKFEQVRSGPERAIVFRINEDEACATEAKSALDMYLDKLPPSKTVCKDAAWLHCVCGALNYTNEDAERRIGDALDAWERVLGKGKATGGVKADDVDRIAKKYNLLGGKWMLFPANADEVDRTWRALAGAMLADKGLGACNEIKVSTHSPTDGNKHVLLGYVKNYTLTHDVNGAAEAIKASLASAGVRLQDNRMLFKPDVYSFLGIYSKNEWGLKPTMYATEL